MGAYSKEDILELIREEDIRLLKLQFTDMYGMPKNVNLPAAKLSKALSGKCVFDGSSIEGFIRRDEEDMFLHPDLDTFQVFPLSGREGVTARVICDIYRDEGRPFMGDPRYILKRVLEEAKKKGYTFGIKPELEFFLFNCDELGNPTTFNNETASYFDTTPLDFSENLRNEMVIYLEDMGYQVASSHHETSPGQHEIDFEEKQGISCADAIATAKILIKMLAKRSGMYATFMPKPKEGVNGSGMHFYMSMYDKDGKDIFFDADDSHKLSKEGYYFMAGIMKHIPGMSLILNPLVNSYKRITPGYDAPVDISWSAGTYRGSLMRISHTDTDKVRVELRSPDPSCNPYLAFALVLSAGLSGLSDKELPDAEGISRGSLPQNLGQALEEYQRDSFIKEVLGDTIYLKLLEAKQKEWEEYIKQVSPWEVSKYLYKY